MGVGYSFLSSSELLFFCLLLLRTLTISICNTTNGRGDEDLAALLYVEKRTESSMCVPSSCSFFPPTIFMTSEDFQLCAPKKRFLQAIYCAHYFSLYVVGAKLRLLLFTAFQKHLFYVRLALACLVLQGRYDHLPRVRVVFCVEISSGTKKEPQVWEWAALTQRAHAAITALDGLVRPCRHGHETVVAGFCAVGCFDALHESFSATLCMVG